VKPTARVKSGTEQAAGEAIRSAASGSTGTTSKSAKPGSKSSEKRREPGSAVPRAGKSGAVRERSAKPDAQDVLEARRSAALKNGKAVKPKQDEAEIELGDGDEEDSWDEEAAPFPPARARGEEGKAGKKGKLAATATAASEEDSDDEDDYGSDDAALDDASFDEAGLDPLAADGGDAPDGARAGANGRRGGRNEDGDVDALISLGKSKGFLTYDEVNDALPDDDVGADQMDRVLSRLDTEDIEVVSARVEADVPPRATADSEPPPSSTRKGGAKREMNDAAYGRSNDPVRMYLRKMGSVALLTREREVEIAKRIEEGENEVLGAILGSPLAVREIIAIGEQLRSHPCA